MKEYFTSMWLATAALIAGTLVLFSSLSGCSTLGNGKVDLPPHTEAVVELAIKVAVIDTVGGHPEKAQWVVNATRLAISRLTDNDATSSLDLIADEILSRISESDLTASEKVQAQALLGAVRYELEKLFESEALDEDARIRIINALRSIERTASIAGAGNS